MAGSKTCGKCGGRMEEGYLLELADHSSKRVTRWIQGPPEKGMFGILKVGKRPQAELQAWRCSRCTAVELYAPDL